MSLDGEDKGEELMRWGRGSSKSSSRCASWQRMMEQTQMRYE